MSDVPAYLFGVEPVVEAFGRWPSFHDAPVVRFDHEQSGDGSIELVLHAFECDWQEPDDLGYFKRTKHHLVHFRFSGLDEVALDRFAASNILFELGLSTQAHYDATGTFRVTLDSAMGSDLCGSFLARRGEVVGLTRCTENGCVIASETDGGRAL